jgi:hypothetical protein
MVAGEGIIRYLSRTSTAEAIGAHKILDIILTKRRHHTIFIPNTSRAVTISLVLYGELPLRVGLAWRHDIDTSCWLKEH